MEPLSSAAIAIATLILNKTFEKTGEKLGETVSNQLGKLLQWVKQKSLSKTDAIEQAEPSGNYNEAVLELESAEKNDPELAEIIQTIAALIQNNPDLLKQVEAIATTAKTEPSIIHNHAKLADKIGMVVQGGTVSLDTMNF